MESLSKKLEETLEQAADDVSVRHVAGVLHYLIAHADIKQYYYELKFVRNGAGLLELIGKALRNLDVLKRDERHKENIKNLKLPSQDDLSSTLKYFNALKTDFIKILSGLAVASCPLCWEERKEGE